MDEEQLKFLHFKGDNVAGDIIFKNSNLSKMEYEFTTCPVNVTFENTTLPKSMYNSIIDGNLILKNAILAKELKEQNLDDMFSLLPLDIGATLKIYNLQGRFLYKWTEEEIKNIKKNWQSDGNRPVKAPSKYVGPKDIWDKLKLLYRGEKTTKTHFTNSDLTDVDDKDISFSAIKKPQDTFLALLGKNNSRG